MKTGYSRNKGFAQNTFPRGVAGSKRGQSALGVFLTIFLIIFLIAAIAAGAGIIYKVYDHAGSVKKKAASPKKPSGSKRSGKKKPGSSGGSDSDDKKVSAEYQAAVAAYKELLSKNITRVAGTGFDQSMKSRFGSDTGSSTNSGTGNGSATTAGNGSGTGTNTGADTGNGTGSGTNAGADTGNGSSTGADTATGTDPNTGSGSDISTGSGTNSDTGFGISSDANTGSGTASSLDTEDWKPANCEFALVYIDSDDIPELLVYNKKDAYHITGYGELYNYDKNSPAHVQAVMPLSLDDLTDLGYYRKTGWYMDHFVSAGVGRVYLKNIMENGSNGTVISKVLQSAGGDRYEVAGYEISSGTSNPRQLNQTEYNDKVAEVTGGTPITKYVFYKNTKENRERYLK